MNLSPDGGATPAPRTEGDVDAMNAAYTSGMEFQGDIDIPVIDWRHYLEDELDMHNTQQSFAARQRMLNADGDAGNQVIWFTDARPAVAFDQTPMAFEVIDEWMANIAAHPEPQRGPQPARRGRSTRASPPTARSSPRAGGCGTACSTTSGPRRLHPAVPDLLVVAPGGRRPVRGRRVEVRRCSPVDRGARRRRLRRLGARRRRAGPARAGLPRRRVRLAPARRRPPGRATSSRPHADAARQPRRRRRRGRQPPWPAADGSHDPGGRGAGEPDEVVGRPSASPRPADRRGGRRAPAGGPPASRTGRSTMSGRMAAAASRGTRVTPRPAATKPCLAVQPGTVMSVRGTKPARAASRLTVALSTARRPASIHDSSARSARSTAGSPASRWPAGSATSSSSSHRCSSTRPVSSTGPSG